MNDNINLIAFGTFGNPNGFKQSFFVGNKDLVRNVKTFDLKTEAIKLFPKSKVYSIRKEFINGYKVIAYSVYTFAKEQTSDRGGTFIGSSILFTNTIAEESVTLSCLNEFQSNLCNNNLQNDVIAVNHSDQLSVSKPKDFDKIDFHLRELEDLSFNRSTNSNLVVYAGVNASNLQNLLKQSIDLLNLYDAIYFTDSNEVAEFVHRRGVFKIVDDKGFKQEIQNLQEDRRKQVESSISEFESEKKRVEEDRKKLFDEFNEQIESNERLHQENRIKIDESKDELKIINQKYDGYLKKIDESINLLKSDRRLDVVKQVLNENKRIFIESVNRKTTLKFINKIHKPNLKTDLQSSYQPKEVIREPFGYEVSQKADKRIKLDRFKVISFVLFLLWMGTLAYLIFSTLGERDVIKVPPLEVQTPLVDTPKDATSSVQELTPQPITELNAKGYRLVAGKIKPPISVEEVVEIIFKSNPRDIKAYYFDQTQIYAKSLLELNKGCFTVDSNGVFFVKDTLRHIPVYKKN